jgi:hypothetical protein
MSRLVLEIGQAEIAVPLKGTISQIRAVMHRYAQAQGIDMTGLTEAQVGEAVLRRILREIRTVAMDRQRRELITAEMNAIDATLRSDNELYDEE